VISSTLVSAGVAKACGVCVLRMPSLCLMSARMSCRGPCTAHLTACSPYPHFNLFSSSRDYLPPSSLLVLPSSTHKDAVSSMARRSIRMKGNSHVLMDLTVRLATARSSPGANDVTIQR